MANGALADQITESTVLRRMANTALQGPIKEITVLPSTLAVEPVNKIEHRSVRYKEVVSPRLCEDYYDEVLLVTASNLLCDSLGHSVTVSNTSVELVYQRSNSNNKTISTAKNRDKFCGKKEFYICDKCHKTVESSKAVLYCIGGIEVAWHPHCLKCYECDKSLSEADHKFYEEKPYCLEHYGRMTSIPKCSKCKELIFDSTYTSAAGSSWHQQHFTCQDCEKPLVDTKYLLVENKHPYCLQCHEKHFPKVRCHGQKQLSKYE